MRVEIHSGDLKDSDWKMVTFEPDLEMSEYQVKAALRHLRRVAPKKIRIVLQNGGERSEFLRS